MENDNLEVRSFEIRDFNKEERTVAGLAVPYNETIDVGGYKERIEPGAFGEPKDVKLFYGHNHRNGGLPIGKVIETKETKAGLEIKAQISKTTAGDEVYTLLRDEVLTKFSVGFRPVENRMEDDVVVRTKADLFEVSVVPMPAYAGATIAEVREDSATNQTKENDENMSENDNIALEVAEIREAFADLERKVNVAAEKSNDVVSTTAFRTGGEFLKALATGDKDAANEFRAYTGATTADADVTRPAWVAQALKLQAENRPVLNLFNKSVLPASGNSIEYPQVSGVSGTVGVQAAEGDDLPYMEVQVDTATAAVKTYGGYSSLSRQAIERSDVAYLDTVLRYQALQYAKATEAAVRTAFTTASGVNTATLAGTVDEAGNWIDLVIDSAALIEDNSKGANAEFVLVSRDVYKRLAHMVDDNGRPLFALNNDGSNTFGNVNLRSVKANIAGFPVVVGTALASNSLYVASSEAVTVFESAGAPVRLQDENIINLTKDFSLYGYMAIAITNPLAIVKVDADLTA